MPDDPDDYTVGWGKPPTSTRFQKGQSGNPKGRPKGRRTFASEIDAILNTPVAVTEKGSSRNVTSRMAALMRLRKKALEGDARAMDRLLDLAARHAAEEEARAGERRLGAVEEEILERFIRSRTGAGSEGIETDTEGSDDEPA